MSAFDYQGYSNKSQGKELNSTRFLRLTISLCVLVLAIGYRLTTIQPAYAGCSDYEDLDEQYKCIQEKYASATKQLSEVQKKKDNIVQKIKNLSSQITITDAEINELQTEIIDVEKELEIINKNLGNRKESLKKKIDLRNQAIRHYAKTSQTTALELFIGTLIDNTTNGFRFSALNYAFDKTLKEEALKWIAILNTEINSFEEDKKKGEELKIDLENSRNSLLALKTRLDQEHKLAQSEQTVLAEEEKRLETRVAELSEKQQSILRQKAGDGIISGYEAPEYKLPDPPFKPAFAAMSYGAYTHYNGMSQYGAKGRAEDGQDYKEILKFYYKSDVTKKDDFPSKINVQGYDDMDFQKYLYGIAEMPSDWPMDALKAQAIAARTYAYRTSKPICITQSCQVFLKSKADNPPPRWRDAVDETKNVILKDASTSQYSSTTGGYINNIGWDKDSGSWPGDAYEKKAKSPWFYKAWYTQSYTSNSSTCGRSTPWLNMEEMADILNAWVVWRKGSGSEKDHISPITTSCWGGNPYSHSEMAEKAEKYGAQYTSISSISVDIGNNGQTATVRFGTNKGTVSIDGSEFKTVFNLRAPGYISLRSRLFDIEFER